MTELKPCPFCNSQVEVFIAIYGMQRSQDYYAIAHPDNTECVIDGVETSAYSDKEELIKEWNRRVKDKDLLDLAISLVQDELISVGKGADIAGIPYYEFEDELKKRGIRWKG